MGLFFFFFYWQKKKTLCRYVTLFTTSFSTSGQRLNGSAASVSIVWDIENNPGRRQRRGEEVQLPRRRVFWCQHSDVIQNHKNKPNQSPWWSRKTEAVLQLFRPSEPPPFKGHESLGLQHGATLTIREKKCTGLFFFCGPFLSIWSSQQWPLAPHLTLLPSSAPPLPQPPSSLCWITMSPPPPPFLPPLLALFIFFCLSVDAALFSSWLWRKR